MRHKVAAPLIDLQFVLAQQKYLDSDKSRVGQ